MKFEAGAWPSRKYPNQDSLASRPPRQAAMSTTAALKPSTSQLGSESSHRRLRRGVENQDKRNSLNGESKPLAKKRKKKHVFCSCRGKDDGTPMICCGQCREWYHFACIGLSELDVDDIDVFVCTPCQAETGLRTVRDWEGPEALEQVDGAILSAKAEELRSKRPDDEALSEATPPPVPPPESDASEPSSDEYVAEDQIKRANKRRLRRFSTPSDGSDPSSGEDGQKKPKRVRLSRNPRRVHTSSSPAPPNLKRKQSNASEKQPSKKHKSANNDDPARKYCLGKLQEIFCRIFLKYPYFRDATQADEELDLDAHFTKGADELADEEKTQLEDKAKEYATQVEIAMFETHSEPDRSGRSAAAGKYKERFRMLDFNLAKPDRVVLHKRIVSSAIPPEALSLMSSTDLASEEEKQSIRLAEQESLAHSILSKQAAPRAKVTHKGLQDIEDENGIMSSQRDLDINREQEEEERRDRERMARLKAIQQQQQQSAGSVPPESPVAGGDPPWGAPPPLPLHLQSPLERPGPNPLFIHSASDTAIQHQIESELNLADLINIDEDTSEGILTADPFTPISENPPAICQQVAVSPTAVPTSPFSPTSPRPTGISPFAVNTSKPDLTTRPSFDLSSVWSGPSTQDEGEQPDPVESDPNATEPEEPKDPLSEIGFFGEEADDNDFDMFLGEQDNEAGPTEESSRKEPSFEESAKVWNGMLHMPLDSTIPQDVPVVARQAGGRVLESDSLLWKTLFPSETLRIDGRVAVDQSSQYLLQMRMNSTKELIAVAFAPPSEPESLAFRFLMDHLLGKQRHGLVFPWGKNAKDPGKELYIIPLLSSDPLPDYLELLDSLCLPKTRTEHYLIGIWILNKGKLAPPPAASNPNPISPPVPQFNSFSPINQLHHPTPPPPPMSTIPSIPMGLPPSHVPPMPPPTVNSAALAAEVASLTPEQIQRMLQSLAAGGTAISSILQAPAIANAPPPQPWMNNAIPPLPYGGIPYQQHPPPHVRIHSASQSPPQHPPYPPPPPPHYQYDQYEQHQPYDGGPRRGRGDRGGRGRGGPGRGQGRDRVNSGDTSRERDTGWGKRGGRGYSERPY